MMKIKVNGKQTVEEGGHPKLVAEISIELTPDDVRDALPGRAQEDFYRNFGEDIIEAIQKYKPYKRV
jgi:hypothetical protein